MIERKREITARIAAFAVAHAVYDAQFEGLFDKLRGYHSVLIEKIKKYGVTVDDLGLVTDPAKSRETAVKINGGDYDLVVCNMVTYATSSVFVPLIREVTSPVILTALQPRTALDYEKASTFMQLENDNICSVPEFICAARKTGKKVRDVIIGTLDEDCPELGEWCRAACALHSLKGARIGMMGHTLEAMYDLHADPAAIGRAFGLHAPLLEIDSLTKLYREVTPPEIEEKCRMIDREFLQPDPKNDPVTQKLTRADKEKAARGCAALEKFVEKYSLDGMAYYYEGTEGDPNRETASSLIVGNTVLNSEGIPMCGEYDVKTVVAMMILDRLGAGGTLGELHPLDFDGDFILIGHDGPHHTGAAFGKPMLRSIKKYHGKPGSGASVEFRLKTGDVTLFGIAEDGNGSFRFIVAEGVSREGPIPPTGNTNTRCFFEPDTRTFIKKWVMEGPTHHFALGVGKQASTIKKIADCLGIEFVHVK
ncbi:MAG: arabinose isomerase [Clostridia bacterium]|nr:arabinose isomerase [Clostridia bacterium]